MQMMYCVFRANRNQFEIAMQKRYICYNHVNMNNHNMKHDSLVCATMSYGNLTIKIKYYHSNVLIVFLLRAYHT